MRKTESYRKATFINLTEQLNRFKAIMPKATLDHVRVFSFIASCGDSPVEMRLLPKLVDMPQATLNRTVRTLAEKSHTYEKGFQLLSIQTHPEDERQRLVTTTDAGKTLAWQMELSTDVKENHVASAAVQTAVEMTDDYAALYRQRKKPLGEAARKTIETVLGEKITVAQNAIKTSYGTKSFAKLMMESNVTSMNEVAQKLEKGELDVVKLFTPQRGFTKVFKKKVDIGSAERTFTSEEVMEILEGLRNAKAGKLTTLNKKEFTLNLGQLRKELDKHSTAEKKSA